MASIMVRFVSQEINFEFSDINIGKENIGHFWV